MTLCTAETAILGLPGSRLLQYPKNLGLLRSSTPSSPLRPLLFFEQNSSYFGFTPELSHSLCSFSDFKIDNKRFFQNIQLP